MSKENEIEKIQAEETPVISSKGNATITWLALAAAGCLAIATWWLADKVSRIEAQLVNTPPVAVVDFVSLVESYGEMDVEELDQRMVESRDAIAALRDAGYLVLDAADIVAAPDDLIITELPGGGY